MSTKLKIIILLLFLVQGAVFYWSYSDKEKAREIELLPYKAYLENPLAVKSIDLSNQGLEELIVDFSQFQNLEYLDLSNNLLAEIPKTLFDLPKLKILNLSNNRLHLAENLSFYNNESIERLDLSDNFLFVMKASSCFDCLKKLKYLNLNDNNLLTMPNLSANKIDTLLLRNNSIGETANLSAALPKNHVLKYFDFSNNIKNNGIIDDASDVLSMRCQSINLSNNDLSFPFQLFNNKANNQLKTLNFSNSFFAEDLDSLGENKIDSLDFSNSNLFLRNDPFRKCRTLKYLDISGCVAVNFELMNFTLNYLSIDLKKETFLFLPNLETLSINGGLMNKIDIFFDLGMDSGYFDGLELPKLKTIKIRNYENENIEKILKKKFPNVEIVIESYKEAVEIDEATKQKFEEEFMKLLEAEKAKNE